MTTDVKVSSDGLYAFHVITPNAQRWVVNNVEIDDWQWVAEDTFVVEDRNLAMTLAQGMLDNGLVVN